MSDWNEKFASAWLTIRKKAGACAANTDLEELKAAVQLGQKRVGQALMAGNIAQGQSGVFDKLSKANEGLGKVGESLEAVQDFCVDITAVGKIHDAIVALSDDRIIYDDPQRAADSFDLLFQGFGRLCKYLPPPAKDWGKFFESFNLFGNVQKNIYNPYFSRLRDVRDGTGAYKN
ncbi:MAG: hypothetical protein QUS14_08130 [Pyrinomonadaceae bacterium]|nr:hypothetical protein [Pyrinomonadaceae bacterium]